MTTSGDRTDRGMVWDHEDCPEDGCDGELQQQDKFNVMCLSCESVWGHAKMGDKHYLQTEDFETVATKPIVMTDGGTSTSDTDRSCPVCNHVLRESYDRSPHTRWECTHCSWGWTDFNHDSKRVA